MRHQLLTVALIPGALACQDQGLTVHPEPPRVALIVPIDGASLVEGVAVEMAGEVADDRFSGDLSALDAYWTVDGDAVCADATISSDGWTRCDWTFEPGQAEVILTAVNPDQESGLDGAFVDVLADAAPEVVFAAPDAALLHYSDTLISFEAVATDADDSSESLSVAWSSSRDGDLDLPTSPDSSGALAGATFLSEGQHDLAVIVIDPAGRTGQAHLILEVGPPNSPPSCEITAPEDGAVAEVGVPVTLRGQSNDLDISADLLTATFSSDWDGDLVVTAPDSSGAIAFTTSDLSANTHTLRLTV